MERRRNFLPGLDRFDRPEFEIDETERAYKLQIAGDLKSAIARGRSDQDLADAVHSALAKSNMLQWRAYWPMSPKGNADHARLWPALRALVEAALRSEEHTSELQSLMRISYAVFCLKKKKKTKRPNT